MCDVLLFISSLYRSLFTPHLCSTSQSSLLYLSCRLLVSLCQFCLSCASCSCSGSCSVSTLCSCFSVSNPLVLSFCFLVPDSLRYFWFELCLLLSLFSPVFFFFCLLLPQILIYSTSTLALLPSGKSYISICCRTTRPIFTLV